MRALLALSCLVVASGAFSATAVPVQGSKVERIKVNSKTILRCSERSFSGVPGACLDAGPVALPRELHQVRQFGEPAILPLQGPVGIDSLFFLPVDLRK